MSPLDQVVAAHESMAEALESFNSLCVSPVRFKGLSLAFEEAEEATVAEAKTEAKQTLLQRFKTWLSKIVAWLRNLVSKRKVSGEQKLSEDKAKMEATEQNLEEAFKDILKDMEAHFEAPQESTNLGDFAIAEIQKSGIIEKAATMAYTSQNAGKLPMLLTGSGKLDAAATFSEIDVMSRALAPIAKSILQAFTMPQGKDQAIRIIDLGNEMNKSKQAIAKFFGQGANERALDLLKKAQPQQVLKAIGSLEDHAFKYGAWRELDQDLYKIDAVLGKVDFDKTDTLDEQTLSDFYSKAIESITGVCTAISWISSTVSTAVDSKLKYIMEFNRVLPSTFAKEIDAVKAAVKAKDPKADDQQVKEVVLTSLGIAHMRAMA